MLYSSINSHNSLIRAWQSRKSIFTSGLRISTTKYIAHSRKLHTKPLPSQNTPKVTHFGYKDVDENEKEHLVGNVFSSVAEKYDQMNDIMSLRMHRIWKDYFVRRLDPGQTVEDMKSYKILDVAGGTGDISFRLLDYIHKNHPKSKPDITVLDINPQMLHIGEHRANQMVSQEFKHSIRFEQGNAELLEGIEDNSIDLYTISFGIRNCTHIDRVLAQAYRVLKPGGVFSCLEFGKLRYSSFLASLYRLYSFSVIPAMGQIVAADRDSYQYLVESIERFPKQEDFALMIRDAGFHNAGQGWEDLSLGIVAIHTGVKL